jgi:uncharacterized protein YigE (DUF2233 family)
MLRAFLCSAALVGLATVSLAADKTDKTDKTKNENEMTATVTKVDAQKNTLTVTMKDKEGKEETKTLTLTNDVKIVDAKDKAATLDSIKVGDEVTLTHRDGKLVEIEREHAKGTAGTAKKGHKHEATITKVDAKNGTVTVKMKDKNGKDATKTFKLTEEVRMWDDAGRAVAIDVFQSGNDVLIVEAEGKLREIRKQKKDSTPPSTKDKK